MITAFFTPYYKFLQKDNFLKFFNEVESLSDLIDKIKIKDKIKIYAHSKDIIKFQFNNNNPDIEYEFLETDNIFEEFTSEHDMVRVKLKPEWRKALGEYIYVAQDRSLQREIVFRHDVLAFQATDLNKMKENVLKDGNIGNELTAKMFFTDEVVAECLR